MMRFVCVLLCAAFAASAADNQLTPAEKKAGWRLLFDGHSYANWVDPTKKSPPGDSFTIEDGCLKAVPHPRFTEDLFSQDKFTDFELEWDWKISPAGNSGVKYRIQDTVWVPRRPGAKFEDMVNSGLKNPSTTRPDHGQDYVIGFEYQMIDNQGNRTSRTSPTQQTAALYDVFAPLKDVTRPVGEFNHSRLVVRGDHVEHWLNGEKVVDASLKDPEVAKAMAKRWGEGSPVWELLVKQPRTSCPISLQNHGNAAWFKNIKIRKL